jgi:hypothetical protein
MGHKTIYRILLALLAVQLAFYVYSLFGRAPDIDDAWIGEHAYWMAKEGHARSELMRGWTSQEERVVIHHKLLTLHGAGFIKVFGFSLYTLKAVSLLYFLLFLAWFYYYTVRLKKIVDHRQLILAALLIFSFHFTFKFSFLFRPEIMIMSMAFFSFSLLEKVAEPHRKALLFSLLPGLLAGLCFAVHLNGLAVVAAGFFFLIWAKKWKETLVFSIGALIGMSLYFYDFTPEYGFHFWKDQLVQSVMGRGSEVPDPVFYLLKNLAREHMRFFHDTSVIAFSLVLIISLVAGFRYLAKDHRNLMSYTFLLWLFVAVFSMQKSRQYILVYFPFLVILMTLVLDKMITGQPGLSRLIYRMPVKIFLAILFLLYLVGTSQHNYRTVKNKFSPMVNRELSQEFISGGSDTLKIVAPMEFIFNEIEYFGRIQGEGLYTQLQKSDTTIRGGAFLRKTREFDVDYILLSPVYRRNLGMDIYQEGDTVTGYIVIHSDEHLSILKHQPVLEPVPGLERGGFVRRNE